MDMSIIVKYYAKWFDSNPFGKPLNLVHLKLNVDVGFCIKNTLIVANQLTPNARAVRSRAAKYNKTSFTNSSLMRITPLAVYLALTNINKLKGVVAKDKKNEVFGESCKRGGDADSFKSNYSRSSYLLLYCNQSTIE
jgi:hypothetical protein